MSAGFLNNTPWVAPITSFNLFKGHITILNWVGASFGDPELGNTQKDFRFLFSFNQISINVKKSSIYYSNLIYMAEPTEHILGINHSFQLGDKISILSGVGYMCLADKILISTGIKYKF